MTKRDLINELKCLQSGSTLTLSFPCELCDEETTVDVKIKKIIQGIKQGNDIEAVISNHQESSCGCIWAGYFQAPLWQIKEVLMKGRKMKKEIKMTEREKFFRVKEFFEFVYIYKADERLTNERIEEVFKDKTLETIENVKFVEHKNGNRRVSIDCQDNEKTYYIKEIDGYKVECSYWTIPMKKQPQFTEKQVKNKTLREWADLVNNKIEWEEDERKEGGRYNEFRTALRQFLGKRWTNKIGWFHFWINGDIFSQTAHIKFYGINEKSKNKIEKTMKKYSKWFSEYFNCSGVINGGVRVKDDLSNLTVNWRGCL